MTDPDERCARAVAGVWFGIGTDAEWAQVDGYDRDRCFEAARTVLAAIADPNDRSADPEAARAIEAEKLLERTVSRVVLLEGALAEAIGIVSGGRNPDSARNAKAREWRALLNEGSR